MKAPEKYRISVEDVPLASLVYGYLKFSLNK